ncbi:MAG: peptide ABC transporter substrate-binding protein [Oscillospiraceae bacterium]|nr:peptide ABC transporter substrate-binding protein [Oscillospiraceae bacterium]
MKTKRMLCLLVSLTLIAGLTACGGGGGGGGGAGGATFTSFIQDEPSTLDASKCNDLYGDAILVNVLEPLVRLEEDANGNNVAVGAGAESWEPNADGSVWTFHLRDNKWSDGQPVTAEQYVYGIQRLLDPQVGSPTSFLLVDCVKNGNAVNKGEMAVSELGAKAIDEKTLEVTLEGPTPYFLALTYSKAMYPVRQDVVEAQGDTYGANAEGMVFNGPFTVTSWVHNSEIILTKNENYWDKDNVALQTVDFKILTDENARYNSFENGSLETVNVGQPEWIDRFNQKNDVTFTQYVVPAIRFQLYNTQDAIFQNEKIRKAFTLAIDRDDVVETIYHGTMIGAYGWVPQGVASGSISDYTAGAPEPLKDLISENGDPKALLLEGMAELGLGSDPSALDITFTFGATTQWIRNYGEYLQQVYKNVLGLQIDLEFNEWGTYQSKINSGDYQVGYMTWSIDYNDPMGMLSLMVTGAGAIPTGWSNAEYDALIAQASTEMDDAKRQELYQKAEYILIHDDGVLCPIVNEMVNRFNYNKIQGMCTNYFSTNSSGLKHVSIAE